MVVNARESLGIGQSGNGNEGRHLDDVEDDGDGAAEDGSGDDGGGSYDEPGEGTESDESKDTRSVAKQKPRILPKTPGHPA